MRQSLSQDNNFLAIEDSLSRSETAGVIILMAPFEKTSSFGMGSAAGPGAIIEASHEVELFDAVLGFEPFREVMGIATMPSIASPDAQTLCDKLEKETAYWLKKKRMVVTLGGEHTSIVGAVKAYCRAYSDLTIVQLDAHSDLRQEYQDNSWSHACAVRRIMDFHSSVVQVAIRSQAGEERELSETLNIPVFYAHRIHADESSGDDWIGSIIEKCHANVYVTLDCDAFDPSVIPSTGTPEPGGLSWNQMDRFMDRLTSSRRLVGFDVNELAPIKGLHHPQFTIAKLIYRILGYAARH